MASRRAAASLRRSLLACSGRPPAATALPPAPRPQAQALAQPRPASSKPSPADADQASAVLGGQPCSPGSAHLRPAPNPVQALRSIRTAVLPWRFACLRLLDQAVAAKNGQPYSPTNMIRQQHPGRPMDALGILRRSSSPWSSNRRGLSTQAGNGALFAYEAEDTTVLTATTDPTSFFQKNRPLQKCLLAGDTDPQWVMPDTIRRLLGSGTLFLTKNALKKICFAHPLDLTMLVVDSFGNFQIAPGTVMCPATEVGACLDTAYYGLLVKSILIESCGDEVNVPDEWREWYEKMIDPEKSPEGYNLAVDSVFLTSVAWPSAYLDIFHAIKDENKAITGQILQKLEPGTSKDFGKHLRPNKVLEQFYLYAGPPQPNQKKARRVVNRSADCAKEEITVHRNILSHILDYVYMLSYTKAEMQLCLMVRRGALLLSRLCAALNAFNPDLFRAVKIERHMCNEGSPCCPLPNQCHRSLLSQMIPVQSTDRPLEVISQTSNILNHVDASLVKHNCSPIDQWKKSYGQRHTRSKDDTIRDFWKLYDPEDHSLWICAKSDECSSEEARNRLAGLAHQIEVAGRRYSFGKVMVTETSAGRPLVRGMWLFAGTDIPDFVNKIHLFGRYEWKRVDGHDAEQEQEINRMIADISPVGEGNVIFARSVC